MKKTFLAAGFVLAALSVWGQSNVLPLDGAVRGAAQRVQDGLGRGATVVVYQFLSENERLSNYILSELFDLLVNSGRFTVLDRTAREVINAELDFQINESAGMISDDSLASLSKRIGAQAIVTGSLDDAAGEYRFRIRVIGTETTAAVVSYSASVGRNDRRIKAFTKTAGEKFGTGALNVIFGLGSYLEGDIAGGVTVTAAYALAAGLFAVEAAALDRDSPAAGVPATLGVTAAGLAFVYGFARPFVYSRSPRLAAAMDGSRLSVVRSPDVFREGALALRMSYSIKF